MTYIHLFKHLTVVSWHHIWT